LDTYAEYPRIRLAQFIKLVKSKLKNEPQRRKGAEKKVLKMNYPAASGRGIYPEEIKSHLNFLFGKFRQGFFAGIF
jgi:hypothetical protein